MVMFSAQYEKKYYYKFKFHEFPYPVDYTTLPENFVRHKSTKSTAVTNHKNLDKSSKLRHKEDRPLKENQIEHNHFSPMALRKTGLLLIELLVSSEHS